MRKKENNQPLTEEMQEQTVAEQAEETAVQEQETVKPKRDKRRGKIRTVSVAITAVVAAAVVLLNIIVGILADRYPITWDITEDSVYTLSENSLELAKQIQKEVKITFFTSQNTLQNPAFGDDFYDTLFRQMYAFANEYVSRTNRKVKVEYVDLTEDPTLASEYGDIKVENYDILFQSGEKIRRFSINDMYTYEQVPNYQTMQYDYQYYSLVEKTFATGLLSVASNADLHATFLTGNGEKTEYIQFMSQLYQDNGYTVHELNFLTDAQIHEKCNVLVIVGADIDFTDAQIERLTTWLNNGGKKDRHLYVLCDPFAKDMKNLYEFLNTYYGIEVTDKLIYEEDPNHRLSYLNSPFYPISTLLENELMPGMEGEQVILGQTLAIKTNKGTNPDEAIIYNTDIVAFPNKTTKLYGTVLDADGNPVTDENGKVKTAVTEAGEYPIVGIAMANEWNYVDNKQVNNYVFVSGGYEVVDSVWYSISKNQALVIDPINTMCGNEIRVDMEAYEMDTDILTFTVGTAKWLGLGVFTIGVPLLLLVVCLVVFIRRKHL